MSDSIICERSFEFTDAQTKADCWAKMAISRKEARETRYWLRVAVRCEHVTAKEVEWELREVNELRAMIIAAIRTGQSSASRGEPRREG